MDWKQYNKERTSRLYHLEYNDLTRTTGRYEIPIIEKEIFEIPKRWIGFNEIKTVKERKCGVHFFLDDYQIERIWRTPELYIDKLLQFDCVLTPDYSLYTDMAIATQIYNTYRNRLVGQILQDNGIKVIPTVSWGKPNTFDFCFDGIEEGSLVAVSTIGVKKRKQSTEIWLAGMNEMKERIKPSAILVYGEKIDYDYQGIETVFVQNSVIERLRKGKG